MEEFEFKEYIQQTITAFRKVNDYSVSDNVDFDEPYVNFAILAENFRNGVSPEETARAIMA